MGVPFQVDVNVVTHGAEKVNELEQKLNALQSKGVDLKVKVDGLDKLDTSKLDKQAISAGKQVSQNLSKGMKSTKISVPTPIDYAKAQEEAKKKTKKIADTIKSAIPEVSDKDATKYAKEQQNLAKKASDAVIKENEKAVKQAKKQSQQISDSYWKDFFSKQNTKSSEQKALSAYYDEQEKKANQIAKIQQRANSGEFEARNAKADKFLSKYDGQNSEVLEKARKTVSEIKSLQSELQSGVYSSGNKKGLKIVDSDQIKIMDQIDEKAKQMKNTFTEISNLESKTLGQGIAERGANNVATYMENNTKALKKYGEQLATLQQQYKSATTEFEKSDLDNQFKNLQSRISAEGLTGKSGWDEFKRATGQIAQFAGIYGAIQNIGMQIPSQMIGAVKDVNAAQIELTKVSDASGSQLTKYWSEASDSAQKYGSTISDVISSTADWSRLGYNLDDAKKLSDVTTLLQKVGDNMTQESSSQGLISTLKGFKMEADEASKVVDVVNEVANTEPIDTAGIFDGLTRSASSMKAANNTFEETVALITAANSVVQDPDSVGTAFKTISMRIRGADTELQQAGLDTEGMAESTAKLRQEVMALSGVDIMKDENNFKSTYDILDELSTKWADLTDIQQASLTELIAGKRQGNIVSSLMTNFDVARKSLQTALNDSEGSGERELETWNQGIEASISHLQASLQKLSVDTISSDFFKGIVDSGTNVVNTIDNITGSIGLLNTAAIGLGIFQGKNNSGKSTWDSPHAFFKRLMPLESLAVMCTSLFISKDSLVTFLNGVGGNAPLSCYE